MIKLLSGDGGGFFNANSAHPFENPTALTGLFEIFLMLAIGAALTNTFGRMVGDERQGWVLYAAMAALFLVGLWIIGEAEMAPMNLAHVAQNVSGNMEGKEVRFGSRNPRCSPKPRPRPPTAPSIRCTTATGRFPALC